MIVYTCQPDFTSMLTCIYYAWASKEGHKNIRLETEPVGQMNMFDEYRHVDGELDKAVSVSDAVRYKISQYFYREVLGYAGYYESDVLDNIYRMLLLGFRFGDAALDMYQYEPVMRSRAIRKSYSNEVCRFKEILRFHEVRKSLYIAHIEPKSRVVEALGAAFTDRMPSEHWMVVDDVHLEAVIHPKNEDYYLRQLTSDELAVLLQTEKENDQYTDMWKVFFDNIAIKERENPSYQRNSFPIWARKHAVEFENK